MFKKALVGVVLMAFVGSAHATGDLGTGLTTSVAGPGLTSVADLEGVLGAGESLIGAGSNLKQCLTIMRNL